MRPLGFVAVALSDYIGNFLGRLGREIQLPWRSRHRDFKIESDAHSTCIDPECVPSLMHSTGTALQASSAQALKLRHNCVRIKSMLVELHTQRKDFSLGGIPDNGLMTYFSWATGG